MFFAAALNMLPCIIVVYWASWRNKSIPFARLFAFGMAVPLPAIFIERFLIQLCTLLPDWLITPATAFIAIAWVEESLKFGVLAIIAQKKIQSSSITDSALSGAVTSMGFSLMENIIYLLFSSAVIQVSLIRIATAVPLHASTGIFIGLGANRTLKLRGCFLIAIFIHGLYDWFLISKNIPDLLFVPVLIAAWILVIMYLKQKNPTHPKH